MAAVSNSNSKNNFNYNREREALMKKKTVSENRREKNQTGSETSPERNLGICFEM